MPNVMGREFPYTPQGMAEAQQYKEALGMRDGGSMGFRPVGYEAGGPVGYADGDAVNQNTQTYSDFDRALKEMPVENLNAYLRDNMFQLKAMAEDNPARAAQLSDVMEKTGFEEYMLNLMQGSMPDSPGAVPSEGGGFDYYPPQTGMEQTMPPPAGMLGGTMPRNDIVPPEGGDQMIMQMPPPPVQRAGGGIMSLGRR